MNAPNQLPRVTPKRPAWRIFSRLVPILTPVLLVGCGDTPNSPRIPQSSVPSPDVDAQRAHFLQEGFGPNRQAREDREARSFLPADVVLYVGERRNPALDVQYAGTFQSLGARFTINGQPWWSTTVSYSSPPGEAGVNTLTAPLWSPSDSGVYMIAITLDPNNQYAEIDEENNSDTLVARTLIGDLIAEVIELDKTVSGNVVRADTVTVGTLVAIRASIFCLGGYPSFRARLAQNGMAVLDTTLSCESTDLGYGVSSLHPSWIANSPGTHVFTLEVDPNHEVIESNLADNVATDALLVIP